VKLFLGFKPDPFFQQEFGRASLYLRTFLIGREEYLQEVHLQEEQWLGKWLGPFPTLEQLVDLEKHLLSLLGRLAPCYPFGQKSSPRCCC
jgi:hypothetical protein